MQEVPIHSPKCCFMCLWDDNARTEILMDLSLVKCCGCFCPSSTVPPAALHLSSKALSRFCPFHLISWRHPPTIKGKGKSQEQEPRRNSKTASILHPPVKIAGNIHALFPRVPVVMQDVLCSAGPDLHSDILTAVCLLWFVQQHQQHSVVCTKRFRQHQ